MSLTSYDLCGPNPNPMTVAEVDALKSLLDPRVIIEHPVFIQIGAERGVSTIAMLEARYDAFIFSIDIGECPGEAENLRKANMDYRKVVRVLGKSWDIAQYWPYPCDFLFIDGDHSEEGVKRDIIGWLPVVKKGGIVAFHDYIPEPIPPEIKGRVVYAVDSLMEKFGSALAETAQSAGYWKLTGMP